MKLIGFALLALTLLNASLYADGPQDNSLDNVRRIPKLGIEVPEADRQALQTGLQTLAGLIEQLRKKAAEDKDALRRELLPDVEIYYRAVHDALAYQEFFASAEIERGKEQLQTGIQRAYELLEKRASWTTQTGLVVRGYRSKLDGTAQPYGLVVPTTFHSGTAHRHRLDLWFHGRGETLSEVAFIDQRSKQIGQFAPADAFVLHTYGRYSNAFKLAGEVDVLEALASVKQRYPIDHDRLVVRGFSMGGAGAWHFAVHYPTLWAAANPGAGFSETPEFLRVFQNETLTPTPYERKLWQLYDCPGYARNLFHCPTVAYSGEDDRQKQAADIMVDYAAKEGLQITHLIGPKTGHKYHSDAAAEVERRLASIVARGRQVVPREVHFTTYTLKYREAAWVQLEALDEHWTRAQVDGRIVDDRTVQLTTRNVRELTLSMPSGYAPFNALAPVALTIDDQRLTLSGPESDRSWNVRLHRVGKQWNIGPAATQRLVKKHGLQGPIDDALLDTFVFVRPTGKPFHAAIGAWAQGELEHAIEHWRRQMRGVARVIDDTQVDDATIASSHLVLWGDPASNRLLAKLAERLPIRWSSTEVVVGQQSFAAEHHLPVLVYPNPLNPERYVVLNSSFTYREYDYLNNARQVPKLPDWAVIDVRTKPNARYPGKIVAADFFDEQWQLK